MVADTSVSVIIPTFNRVGVLKRAIESVREQTHLAHELILIDDGSEDDTRRHFEDCMDVRYIYQPNAGVSAARNRGINIATGEWIAFLDSDDAWLPTKLATQLKCLRDQPSRRLCHTEEIWIRNGQRVNQKKKHRKGGGDQFGRSVELCCISPSSVLLHRTIFDDYGVFDTQLPACEDYDLWLRLCAMEQIAFVPSPQIYKYGGHADQLSHRFDAMDRFRVYALDKLMRESQLSQVQRDLVLASIRRRLRVLLAGAAKHGNTKLAESLTEYEVRWGPLE